MPWTHGFLLGVCLVEVHLEEDLEKAPEAASEQRYARDAEEVPRRSFQVAGFSYVAGRRATAGGRNPG